MDQKNKKTQADLKATLDDLFNSQERVRVTTIVGVVGGLASILGLLYAVSNDLLTSSSLNIVSSVAFHLLYLLIPAAIYFAYKKNKQKNRARAFGIAAYLHYCNHVVRDYVAYGKIDHEHFNEVITELANTLATVMSSVTGTQCNVSIKTYDPQNSTVKYMGGNSMSGAKHAFNTTDDDQTNELASLGNSDIGNSRPPVEYDESEFSSISRLIETGAPYYMVGDIHTLYKNGKQYKHPKISQAAPTDWNLKTEMFDDMPVDFSSVFCIPIRYTGERTTEVIGFLSIKSRLKHAFVIGEHRYIIASVADIIYIIYRQFIDKLTEKCERETSQREE